ncbi:hypothetical protein FHX64_000357 [Microbacter margulisiae]|uniref:Uncharacterized protein n=1 Tax=Microbacter margulisiae TaxID=1350067 RepID=A0A7W5DNJ8_9PORP|nr:hypothetical protein [Microbacter margulisiae]
MFLMVNLFFTVNLQKHFFELFCKVWFYCKKLIIFGGSKVLLYQTDVVIFSFDLEIACIIMDR